LLSAHALKCASGASFTEREQLQNELLEFLQPTEAALDHALESQDWDNVNMHLIALGNSRLAQHTPTVERVLNHPATPKMSTRFALSAAANLKGDHAKQLLISTSVTATVPDEGNLEWSKGYKFPKDGDKTTTPPQDDPRFQVEPTFSIGFSKDDGLNAAFTFKVKLWEKKYTYDVIKIMLNAGTCGGEMCPVITVSLMGGMLYTSGDHPKDDPDALDQMKHVSETKVGYCQTDIEALNGLKLKWEKAQDLYTAPKFSFTIGPVPLSIVFKITGSVGFTVFAGALGGDKAKLVSYGWADRKTESSTGAKCGDGTDPTKGLIVGGMPEGSIACDATAGIDLLIVRAGVGLEITIISLKLPMSLDAMFKPKTATCFGLQMVAEAISGRFYLFIESWFSGRNEWDVFSWSGPSWTWPESKQMLGSCSSGAGISPAPPPQEPEPNFDMCEVGLYPGENYGGSQEYKYFVKSASQTGKEIVLPAQVQDVVKSIKTFGRCRAVECVDDDGGAAHGSSPENAWESINSDPSKSSDNGMIWYDQAGISSLTNDLWNDIYSVYITALPAVPQDQRGPGMGLPQTEWHKVCFSVQYQYSNYIGWLFKIGCNSQSGCEVSPLKTKLRNVESIQLSPACEKVVIYDDDEEEEGFASEFLQTSSKENGRQDVTRYSSWSSLDDDVNSDVLGLKIYRSNPSCSDTNTNNWLPTYDCATLKAINWCHSGDYMAEVRARCQKTCGLCSEELSTSPASLLQDQAEGKQVGTAATAKLNKEVDEKWNNYNPPPKATTETGCWTCHAESALTKHRPDSCFGSATTKMSKTAAEKQCTDLTKQSEALLDPIAKAVAAATGGLKAHLKIDEACHCVNEQAQRKTQMEEQRKKLKAETCSHCGGECKGSPLPDYCNGKTPAQCQSDCNSGTGEVTSLCKCNPPA
jgi:hypothetical protein